MTEPEYPYVWHWRDGGPRQRAALDRKGQRCRVIVRGSNGNLLIEFEDGFRTVAPRHAIRKAPAS